MLVCLCPVLYRLRWGRIVDVEEATIGSALNEGLQRVHGDLGAGTPAEITSTWWVGMAASDRRKLPRASHSRLNVARLK